MHCNRNVTFTHVLYGESIREFHNDPCVAKMIQEGFTTNYRF